MVDSRVAQLQSQNRNLMKLEAHADLQRSGRRHVQMSRRGAHTSLKPWPRYAYTTQVVAAHVRRVGALAELGPFGHTPTQTRALLFRTRITTRYTDRVFFSGPYFVPRLSYFSTAHATLCCSSAGVHAGRHPHDQFTTDVLEPRPPVPPLRLLLTQCFRPVLSTLC